MRRQRVDYEGAWHHVMNRGARRSPIFTTAADAHRFLGQIAAQIERTGIEVHAYCLMTNHFHLLVRSPDRQLSDFMQQLSAGYTRLFNRWRGYDGPLFRGRFLSKVVDTDAYLSAAGRYIMRNPIDVRPAVPLDRYRWSSYGAYLGLTERPDWLTTDFLWRFHGSSVESLRAHVEGEPIVVPIAVLLDVLSMQLAQCHPDPTIDTVRLERLAATAVADHLAHDRAAELINALGFASSEAERKARQRARQRLETSPFLVDAIERTLALVS